MYRTLAISIPALVLFGCKDTREPASANTELSDLAAAVDALQQENAALNADIDRLNAAVGSSEAFNPAEMVASVTALQADVAALESEGFVTSDEMMSQGFASKAWVDDQSFVDHPFLASKRFVDDSWIEAQGFAKGSETFALEGRMDTVESQIAKNAANVNTNAASISTNSTDIHTNFQDISALGGVAELMDYVSVDSTNHEVLYEGANVFINSGAGHTESVPNGLGNLVVGYGDWSANTDTSGSHNVVMGTDNGFSSYGGLVGGFANDVAAPFAMVLTGSYNNATDEYAVVVSGKNGDAAAPHSVVVSGFSAEASGSYSAVLTGYNSIASGSYSAVLGGSSNQATAAGSVAAGLGNKATESHEFAY